ncbi:indigoidine synthase A-like protein [Medicago truncatula]|uniref:Indigoidine synthase A-like protein n=1 Tax=Medicago truncatula TaxID=3880 RepID=A0A072UHL3_MEDTR|nr:indigoidine synthase A-like protein [Medicago truncatula]
MVKEGLGPWHGRATIGTGRANSLEVGGCWLGHRHGRAKLLDYYGSILKFDAWDWNVPCRVDTPEECASLIEANIKLKVGSGILIGVPIPQEQSASGHIIESAIKKALEEAREKNISGNAQTPFLLDRVNALTGGASLASNIALVKNNALIGAKVAVALAPCSAK